jgi:hypothetical protein
MLRTSFGIYLNSEIRCLVGHASQPHCRLPPCSNWLHGGSMPCSYIRWWYKTAGVQTGLSEATPPPPSVRCRCATILLHRADRLPSPILLCAGHLLKRRRVTGAVSPSSETIVRLPVRACHAASPSPSANRLPSLCFPSVRR